MYVHGGSMVFQKYLRCLIGPDITLRNVYQVCNGTWYLLLKYYQAKWRFCLDIPLKFTQRCTHTHHPYFLHSLGVPHTMEMKPMTDLNNVVQTSLVNRTQSEHDVFWVLFIKWSTVTDWLPLLEQIWQNPPWTQNSTKRVMLSKQTVFKICLNKVLFHFLLKYLLASKMNDKGKISIHFLHVL